MTKQNLKKLSKIKNNCILLRSRNQLPVELCSRIMALNNESEEDYVKKLMFLSDMYMRVNGFYKKYPELAAQYNKEIIEYFKNN